MRLDHVVENAQVKLIWGDQKPTHYTISTSFTGKNWTKTADVSDAKAIDSLTVGNARYIKLELLEKTADIYDLREIEVLGKFNDALDTTNENILENSGFEVWEPIVVPHPDQPNTTVSVSYTHLARLAKRQAIVLKKEERRKKMKRRSENKKNFRNV